MAKVHELVQPAFLNMTVEALTPPCEDGPLPPPIGFAN